MSKTFGYDRNTAEVSRLERWEFSQQTFAISMVTNNHLRPSKFSIPFMSPRHVTFFIRMLIVDSVDHAVFCIYCAKEGMASGMFLRWPPYRNHGPARVIWAVVHFPLSSISEEDALIECERVIQGHECRGILAQPQTRSAGPIMKALRITIGQTATRRSLRKWVSNFWRFKITITKYLISFGSLSVLCAA